jgi:hypothetical protein
VLLAGLEAGMVGALWMLAWLGISATWQQRSFWSPENLMATAFDRNATLPPGFRAATCAGLALYLLMYSLLGAVFAAAVRDRVPRSRVMLLSVTFALAWYYFSFRWAFKFTMPLVALLHVERSTMLGHLVYGTILGRYPVYAERLVGTPEAGAQPVAEEAAAESRLVETAEAGVQPGAEETSAESRLAETAEAGVQPVAEDAAAESRLVEAGALPVAERAVTETVEQAQDGPPGQP